MPALQDVRHERLAQDIATGMPYKEALKAHGFNSTKTWRRKDIQARIAEIVAERERVVIGADQLAQMATAITKERVMLEFWDNAMKAKGARPVLDDKGVPVGVFVADFAASNKALEMVGKELGMFGIGRGTPPANILDGLTNAEIRTFIHFLDKIESAATGTGVTVDSRTAAPVVLSKPNGNGASH